MGEDKTTMNLVLDSVSQLKEYGIIINKVDGDVGELLDDEEQREAAKSRSAGEAAAALAAKVAAEQKAAAANSEASAQRAFACAAASAQGRAETNKATAQQSKVRPEQTARSKTTAAEVALNSQRAAETSRDTANTKANEAMKARDSAKAETTAKQRELQSEQEAVRRLKEELKREQMIALCRKWFPDSHKDRIPWAVAKYDLTWKVGSGSELGLKKDHHGDIISCDEDGKVITVKWRPNTSTMNSPYGGQVRRVLSDSVRVM